MDNNDYKKFHHAIISKDWQTLRTFFYEDSNQPSYDDEHIVSLLIKYKWILTDVVTLGKLNLTKLFLEMNETVSVQDVDSRGWTGLHRAALDCRVDQVKFLLEHNADPNIMNECCDTPLDCPFCEAYVADVSQGEMLGIMKILIDAGAKPIIIKDNISYLQIENALMYGNLETVEFALNLNIDLRAHYNENGNTVLHYLAQNEQPILTQIMLGRNVDVNARNNRQESPLHLAAWDAVVAAVVYLLSVGANVNSTDVNNRTPLWLAIENFEDCPYSYTKCVQLLLQYEADIQMVSIENNSSITIFDTILEYKRDQNISKVFELMLEHLALQEVNGLAITEIIQSKIQSDEHYENYLNYCKKTLATKVFGSITLHELLCCSEEKLVPYMRNADLVQDISTYSEVLNSQTQSYGDWLEKRLEKASQTAKLRDSAAVVICKLMKIEYNSYSFIVDSILRYLKDQDLEMLSKTLL